MASNKRRKPQIRERPKDVLPGDLIHAAKLVDEFLKDHPEEVGNRAELIQHANRVGIVRATRKGVD